MVILSNIIEFAWDESNINKNWDKHKVSHIECEEIFFNKPIIVEEDIAHSIVENRYYSLGKTDNGRLLFVIFTIRDNKIRVISARDMNKKERTAYYEEIKKNTEI